MENIEQTVSGRQRRRVSVNIGLSSISNIKPVCFASAIRITGLVESAKARVPTFHDSSQAFLSTVSFDILVII